MSRINIYGDEEVYGEPFPGVHLVRLVNRNGLYTVNGVEMEEEGWGLTFSNDPSFIFSMDPVPDPCFDKDEIEEEDWTEEIDEAYHKFMEAVAHYEARTHGSLGAAYLLLQALIKHGYSMEKHGRPEMYLVHHLYLFLESVDWKPTHTNKRL